MKSKKLFVALGATTLLALASCGAKAISKDDFVKRYETALKERGNLAISSVTASGKVKLEAQGKSQEVPLEATSVKVEHDGGIYYIADPTGQLGSNFNVGYSSLIALSAYLEVIEKNLTVTYYDFMISSSSSSSGTAASGSFKEEMTFNSKGLLSKDYYRLEVKYESQTTILTMELNFGDYK